jgi:hypothetical protein
LSNGAFGNNNGLWVFDFIGLMEEAPLDWSEFAKGFCTRVLGRTPNFQVVATGSQQALKSFRKLLQNFIKYYKMLLEKVV